MSLTINHNIFNNPLSVNQQHDYTHPTDLETELSGSTVQRRSISILGEVNLVKDITSLSCKILFSSSPQQEFQYMELTNKLREAKQLQLTYGTSLAIRCAEAFLGTFEKTSGITKELALQTMYRENQRVYLERLHNLKESYLPQLDTIPHVTKRSSHLKYDKQIQLSLGTGKTAYGLAWKAYYNHVPSYTIDLRLHYNGQTRAPEEVWRELTQLKELTLNSRIYLIGHCYPGSSYLTSNEGDQVSFLDFVRMLQFYAPQLRQIADGKRLKISIIACHGGLPGFNGEDSFAMQLSRALDQADIPTEVIARTGYNGGVIEGFPPQFKKLVDGRHHTTGDKISIATQKGHTRVKVIEYDTDSLAVA